MNERIGSGIPKGKEKKKMKGGYYSWYNVKRKGLQVVLIL